MPKSLGSGASQLGFKWQILYLTSVGPWASVLTSRGVLIFKMSIIIAAMLDLVIGPNLLSAVEFPHPCQGLPVGEGYIPDSFGAWPLDMFGWT